MSDDPIRHLLRARGVAEHIVAGGIEGLMAAWEQTAAAIEAGYSLTLDDYLNDLDARQILEIVLRAIPDPDGPLLNRLRAADARRRARLDRAPQLVVLRDPACPGRGPRRRPRARGIRRRPISEVASWQGTCRAFANSLP
jgi:hypothetical protein